MGLADKVILWRDLERWRAERERSSGVLVATNGCFDLLHVGHARYLEQARSFGDALLVGVNGDASVKALKGEGRPVNPAEDRAALVAALECVSAVCVFEDTRADRFLRLARPNVWVKGGDYTLDTLDAEERRAVEDAGGRVCFAAMVAGKSTTRLIQRVQA